MKSKKTVLVAALDWGLGHASRCIPIVEFLENNGCNVILASSDKAGLLLQKQFPHLTYLELPSYSIQYAKHGRTDWKIALQVPKILSAINKEQKALLKICKQYKLDAIISDNRFGLYHKDIPTAFISHQLNLQTGIFQFSSTIVNAFQKRFIQKFSECWIPDFEGDNNLSGILSQSKLNIPSYFIGPLSRDFRIQMNDNFSYTFCFLLSGPEPQRTFFEKSIVSALRNSSDKAILIRGTQEKSTISYPNNCKVYDILADKDLENCINDSEIIVGRSGYSSVMDAAKWQKKWAFCPTPNQPEQEYLASRLRQKWEMYVFESSSVSLAQILNNSKKLQIEKQSSIFDYTLTQFLKLI